MNLRVETPEEARTLAVLLRERRAQLAKVCARAAEVDGFGWPEGEAELARVDALLERVDALRAAWKMAEAGWIAHD